MSDFTVVTMVLQCIERTPKSSVNLNLGDVANHIVIDRRKFSDYALNPNHPRGSNKAHVFERMLGFSQHNYEYLLQQIEELALETEAQVGGNDVHCQRYTVDIEM